MEAAATKATFQKYSAYKDSEVEWLGEIPEGWEISRLRNVFSFSKGLTITKENLQEQGVYCVNYGEIHSRFGFEVNPEIHPLKCVSEDYLINEPNSLLTKGDFVFADTSEDIEGSGNFTYLNSSLSTFAGYHTIIARLKISVNARFAAYVITSQSFRNQIRSRVKGVKVFSISQSLLKTVSFWFPSEVEQTAIANFLNDKTTKIDRAIAPKEQLIALLQERKQIVIQQAVTKGLDPQAKMKDSGVEWIGEIPEHWEVRRSKFLFTQRKEFARENDVQLSATQAYGVIPQHDYEERIGRRVVKIQFHLDKRKHVELDDFVISMRSFQGGLERAWASGCIRSSYIVLKPAEKLDPGFYSYLFKTPKYISALQSTANFIRDGQDLNFNNFSQVDLFVAPLGEQKQIAQFLQTQSFKIDQAITLQQTQIEKLKEYKATLIDSAVTGKIKVF